MQAPPAFLFGKINVVDLIVIIIVIAAICLTYFKFNLSEHSDVTSSNAKAEYTIKVTSLRDFTVKEFAVGDKIFEEETGKCIGIIKDISVEDSYDYFTKTDGEVVYSKLPQRYNAYLLIETDVVLNERGVSVNGVKSLHKNQNIVVYTQKIKTEGQVIEVNIEQ